jgi:hypothetical protein
MALKVPAEAESGPAAGDEWKVQRGLQEKQGWQAERAYQGNPFCDIVRVLEYPDGTGDGDLAAGVAPAQSDASILNQPVCVFSDQKAIERRFGSLAKGGDKEFLLYPVAEGDDVRIRPTDLIRWNGCEYRPVRVDYDEDTGRCDALARDTREEAE